MRIISFFIISLLSSQILADVIGTTGQIKFDTQMDNQAEMTLNSTGLGIGVAPSTNLHVNGNAIVSEQLFVGGSSGSSNLNINGTIGYGFETVSANTTLGANSIVLVDSSSDNITINLPYAGNVTGRQYQIKKISTENSVWISGGGNLIDDTSPIELPESTSLASVKLISDGLQWYKIAQKDINETVASDNLVGWWKLDETSRNTVYDSSGYGNHGTIENMSSDNIGVTGLLNRCLDFDSANNDFISFSSPNNIPIADEPYTISCWIYARSHGSNGLVGWGNYGTSLEVNAFRLGTSNRLNSYWWGSGDNDLIVIVFNLTGNWHHLVTTYDGTTKYIFLNGIQVGSENPPTHIVPNANNLTIGKTNTTEYFNGKIDDVRIYNRSITPSEIQALYNQGQ